MPNMQYSPDEVVSRGETLYERLRVSVESGNRDKFLVIDINSGDYEIDADDLTATKRLIARHSAAMTYGVRIGHAAAYRFGGRTARL